MTASILSSVEGFERYSALLIAAASRPAPAAGNTSQPKKMIATSQRIIRQPSAKCLTTMKFGLASSSPAKQRRVRKHDERRLTSPRVPAKRANGSGAWPARCQAPQAQAGPTYFPPLRRPLHHRLFDRLFGIAEIMRGIDQCDVGQRLREIPGLTSRAGIELLRQEAEIVRHRDHPVEQHLRLANLACQHISMASQRLQARNAPSIGC